MDNLQQFHDWLVQSGASEKTTVGYVRDLRKYTKWLSKQGLTTVEATPEVLERYKAALMAVYAPASVTRFVFSLRRFYRLLHVHGLVQDDPTANLSAPSSPPPEQPHPLPPDFVRLLLEAPAANTKKGARNRAIIGLLVFAQLRPAAVARLELADVSADGWTIRVDDNEILLPALARDRLLIWLAVRSVTGRGTDEGGLFVNLRGRRGDPQRLGEQGVHRVANKYLGLIGAKKAGFYVGSLPGCADGLAVDEIKCGRCPFCGRVLGEA